MELLLYYRRHSLYDLELHERSNWRAITPEMHQSFLDTTLSCVYCKPVHTSPPVFHAQLHMTTKLTYLITAYYTLNDGFTANEVSFYDNKVG